MQSEPSVTDATIIALGDSTVRGPARADWVGMLPDLLGIPTASVANEGREAERSAQGLVRMALLVGNERFPAARQIIFCEGGDDVIRFIALNDPQLRLPATDPNSPLHQEFNTELDRIQLDLQSDIAFAQEAGWQPYLVTYYPIPPGKSCGTLLLGTGIPYEHFDQRTIVSVNEYISELNARIRSIATDRGARLIDVAALGETLLSDSENYFDCLHLSRSGNEQVAELVAATLRG